MVGIVGALNSSAGGNALTVVGIGVGVLVCRAITRMIAVSGLIIAVKESLRFLDQIAYLANVE